jgi:hypothetical protein
MRQEFRSSGVQEYKYRSTGVRGGSGLESSRRVIAATVV